MATGERATVTLANRLDDEPELAQVMHIARPARTWVVYRRASPFAGFAEVEQCPSLAATNTNNRSVADLRPDLESDAGAQNVTPPPIP